MFTLLTSRFALPEHRVFLSDRRKAKVSRTLAETDSSSICSKRCSDFTTAVELVEQAPPVVCRPNDHEAHRTADTTAGQFCYRQQHRS